MIEEDNEIKSLLSLAGARKDPEVSKAIDSLITRRKPRGFRALNEGDAGKVGAPLLEYIFLPHRSPRVLAGVRLVKADIGRVGPRYAEIWVREAVDEAPKGISARVPNLFRARLDSGRIWIIESFKKEAQK